MINTKLFEVAHLDERLHYVRGYAIMLDYDVAELLHIQVKEINQAVKRNQEYFPADFYFSLTENEYQSIKPKRDIEGRGKFSKYFHNAFTAQGVAMLVGIFRGTDEASIKVAIFRTCFRLKQNFNLNKNTDVEFGQEIQQLKQRMIDLETKATALPHKHLTYTTSKAVPAFKREIVDQIENVLTIVSSYFGITVKDIKSARRLKKLALPRQIAMYLLRQSMHLGYKEIGELLGKDHTTILHACQKIKQSLNSDPAIAKAVKELQSSLPQAA